MAFQLGDLNDFLSSRSYVEGYVPSQGDVAVFEHIAGSCVDVNLNHLLRWQRHIASYSPDERLAFPGIKKDVGEYGIKSTGQAEAEKKPDVGEAEDDDDDFELFGDVDVDEEKKKQDALKEKILKEAEERQKKKKAAAKSTIVLEVKGYGDETEMGEIERIVRSIEMEGLLWGTSKLVPVVYDVVKLQITAVIMDELVSTDELCELIEKNDHIVQSTDIVSFQKI